MASLRYEHGDVCSYDIERLLLPVDIMMVLVTYGNTGVSASLSFKWILLPVHIDVNTALCASYVGMASLWYGQGRGDECPSRPAVHGPPPRPDLTDFWNNRRQESVPFVSKVHSRRPVTAVRPRPAPTARSDELLQQSAPGICAVCFKSPSRRPVPRPALTDFCNNRRKESVPFVSKVRPGGPSRPAVHGRLPRPALTDFWNNRRQESVPFVSKVRPGGPSRLSVHDPIWLTFETIGVRNPCRLFQKSIPAARHGCPSTARSDGLLKQSAWGIRAVCFKSPSQRPVTDVRHGPLWRTSETNGAPYCRDMAPSSLLSVFSMSVIFVSMVRSWPRRGDGFPPTLPFGVLTCSPRDGESLLMSRGSALGARGYWTENSRQSVDNGCNRTQGCN